MENHLNGTAVPGPGPVTAEMKESVEHKIPVAPDLNLIRQWMQRDLSACISFLSALNDDAELKEMLAVWLKGRVDNHHNAKKAVESIKNQTEMFPS